MNLICVYISVGCCGGGGGGGGDVSHAHVPVSGIKKYNTNATTKELYYS